MLTLLLAVSKTQAVPTQFSVARAAFNCFLSGTVCLGVILLPPYAAIMSFGNQSVLEKYPKSYISSFIHLVPGLSSNTDGGFQVFCFFFPNFR